MGLGAGLAKIGADSTLLVQNIGESCQFGSKAKYQINVRITVYRQYSAYYMRSSATISYSRVFKLLVRMSQPTVLHPFNGPAAVNLTRLTVDQVAPLQR